MQAQSIIIDQRSEDSITDEESTLFSSTELSESTVSVDDAVVSKKKNYVKSTATNYKKKGKERVKVKVNNKKVHNTTKDKDINNAVDKVSTRIEPPRDKDGNLQYHSMSLSASIYKRDDDPST